MFSARRSCLSLISVARAASGFPILLALTHLIANALPAQNAEPGLERILPRLLTESERGLPDAVRQCKEVSRTDQALCEGLIKAHFGSRVSQLGATAETEGIGSPLTVPLTERRLAAESGRAILTTISRGQPERFLAWYGLAELELDRFERPAAARTLAERAGKAPDAIVGVVALLEARINFRMADTLAAWRAWHRAVADSSVFSQELLATLTASMIHPAMAARDTALDVRARNQLVAGNSALRAVIQERLTRAPIAIPMIAAGRFYAMEQSGVGRLVGAFALRRLGLINENQGELTSFPINVRLTFVRLEDGRVYTHDAVHGFKTPVPPVRQPGAMATELVPTKDRVRTPNLSTGTSVWVGRPAGPKIDSLILGMGLEIAVPPGHYFVTMNLTQRDGRGYIETLQPIEMPSPDAMELFASDLVLGWDGHGYSWRAGMTPVFIHPTGIFPADAILTLFTQLRGLTPNVDLEATVDFYAGLTLVPGEKPILTFRLNEKPEWPQTAWSRQISLSELKAGDYRVRVTFVQEGSRVVREDRVTVVK